MSSSTELATIQHVPVQVAAEAPAPMWTPERVDLVKRTICKDSTDDELDLFMMVCQRTRLDPFARQIFAVQRKDKKAASGKVMTIQISIDGFRLISERTGKYEGLCGPFWCGPDGVWKDVWLDDDSHPTAAKVGVYKAGAREPTWGIARWKEFAQTYADGNPMGLWGQMDSTMLAKCAEAQAHRKAFPGDFSGLYAVEEMAQATPLENQPALPEHLELLEFRLKELAPLDPATAAKVQRWYDEEQAGLTQGKANQALNKLRNRIAEAQAARIQIAEIVEEDPVEEDIRILNDRIAAA